MRRVALALVAASLLLLPDAAWAQRRGSTPPPAAPTEDYDIVFFGPQGAVFLRLKIDAGRNGVTVIRRSYASGLFRALDSDGDGTLNAAEAAQVPSNGQRSAGAEMLGEGWTALDVSPQDGAISDEELFQFVDQQLGARFRIEAARPRLQQTVQLSSQLDTDGDGLISRGEIEQGLAVLQSFDFDDDEMFSVAELQPFPTAILQAQIQEEANRPSELAVNLLQSPEDRDLVRQRLLNLYGAAASDQVASVPLERIGMPAHVVQAADKNQDSRLDADELQTLLQAPTPALELAVLVSRARVVPPQRPKPAQLLEFPSGSGDARTTPALPGRVELLLAGMDVQVRANDNKEGGISDVNLELGFYLQRFLQFDTDKNSYLNEAEFASLQLPGADFAAVDADRDGMLTRDELRQHVQHSAALSQAALVLTLSDEAKTLFEILDTDRDNRLGPREFAAAATQLREYDRDRDGRIGRAELRDKYGFTVSAARPQFLNEPFNDPNMMAQARQGRPRPQTAGPTWFRKMDRNQDGDLTWREFLGTRANFDRIDADGNGLIDLNEAVGASAASAATSASQ